MLSWWSMPNDAFVVALNLVVGGRLRSDGIILKRAHRRGMKCEHALPRGRMLRGIRCRQRTQADGRQDMMQGCPTSMPTHSPELLMAHCDSPWWGLVHSSVDGLCVCLFHKVQGGDEKKRERRKEGRNSLTSLRGSRHRDDCHTRLHASTLRQQLRASGIISSD